MRVLAGALALSLMALWLLPAQSFTTRPAANLATEKLAYDVEWRLIHAGTVVVETQRSRAALTLESAGMVSALFKIHDVYTVNYDDPFCATSSLMDSFEGKRHHETKVTYDRERNHATFLERDLLRDTVIRANEIEVPHCVHDVIGALLQLRGMTVEPGQTIQIPMSDGRRSAAVKVEAQDREEVKTPAGAFKTVRIEPLMLNNIVYSRKGHVFIWVTDDARHLPVQIRLRMQFPIGTVTLQLQKEEHS
jgi:hypothetical protein